MPPGFAGCKLPWRAYDHSADLILDTWTYTGHVFLRKPILSLSLCVLQSCLSIMCQGRECRGPTFLLRKSAAKTLHFILQLEQKPYWPCLYPCPSCPSMTQIRPLKLAQDASPAAAPPSRQVLRKYQEKQAPAFIQPISPIVTEMGPSENPRQCKDPPPPASNSNS